MQDDMWDNDQEYLYFSHGLWCGLLYTFGDKDNMKRAAFQIKIFSNQMVVLDSDNDAIPKVPCKKKDVSGFIPERKQNNKTPSME